MPFWRSWLFWLLPVLIAGPLAVWGALVWSGRLAAAYRLHFAETRQERLFLASIGFFTAVAVVRGITLAIHYGIGPFHDVSVGGRHLHHLVWGILLLLAVGYGWLAKVGTGAPDSNVWAGRLTALAYGVGSALTLDEYALWLNLRDVYWQREGRASLEAVALFGALLSASWWGGAFLRAAGRELARRRQQAD